MTIWKYVIEKIDDEVTFDMPGGAQVLHVGEQSGLLCLWALVDPNIPKVQHTFFIRGTGHQVSPILDHVGSAWLRPFMWHVFRRRA